MGNYQSQIDAVAKEIQKKISELDVVRDINRMAVERVDQEPGRLDGSEPPHGIDGFEAAKQILAALSQEISKITQGADAALKRGDSMSAKRMLEKADEKVQEHEPVANWVRQLAEVAVKVPYAASMSQKAIALDPTEAPWIVIYMEDWATYVRAYGVGHLEKYLLSRDLPARNVILNYAFFTLNADGCQVFTSDSSASFQNQDPAGVFPGDASWANDVQPDASGPAGGVASHMLTLKARYPNIKILPSIGGWSLSHTFHDCLANHVDAVVENMVNVVRVWGFDGIDLDWEYPECNDTAKCGCQGESVCTSTPNQAAPGDWENYKTFTSKLREGLNALGEKTGRRYLITGAFGMNPKLISGGNDVWENPTPWDWLCNEGVFDFLNLMTYDFYGPWAAQTGQLAPLFTDPDGPPDMMSCDDSIKRILAVCDHPEKLMMGLATYAKSWKDVPRAGKVPGLYQNSTASGDFMGPGTYEKGTLSWWQVKEKVLTGGDCAVAPDEATQTKTAMCSPTNFPPIITGKSASKEPKGPEKSKSVKEGEPGVFVSFEDGDTWRAKMEYARSNGLGGAIIWAAPDMGNGGSTGEHHAELLNGLFSGWFGRDVQVGEPKPLSGTWPPYNKWNNYPCPIGPLTARQTTELDYNCPPYAELPDFTPLPTVDPIQTGDGDQLPDPGTGGGGSDTTIPSGDDKWWTESATQGRLVSILSTVGGVLFVDYIL